MIGVACRARGGGGEEVGGVESGSNLLPGDEEDIVS